MTHVIYKSHRYNDAVKLLDTIASHRQRYPAARFALIGPDSWDAIKYEIAMQLMENTPGAKAVGPPIPVYGGLQIMVQQDLKFGVVNLK